MFDKAKYNSIKNEIPKEIKILAATKTKSINDIKQAIESGIKIIGENYVNEAEEKYNELKELLKEKNIEFHLIGHLQSNKAKVATAIFDCIQTVDSIKLANKLDSAAKELDKKLDIFIEVNFEAQKSGILASEIDSLVKEINNLQNLNLRGFMTIPPIGKEEETYPILKKLKDRYNLPELSIGMSQDYLKAIKQGSTLIRLGRILFGERS